MRGETFDSRMGEDAGKGSRKTKTIRQHVFVAGHAELFTKPVVAVKDLPNDRFGVGRIYVAFFHRRAGRKPATGGHVLLQPLKVGRIILFHHPITISASEVEDVMRILLEQRKVVAHRLGEIFLDDLRIFPTPFGVEVRIRNGVESRFFGEIGAW